MIDVLIVTAVKEEYDAVLDVSAGVVDGSEWATPPRAERRGAAGKWLAGRPRRLEEQELWFLAQLRDGKQPKRGARCQNFTDVVERLRASEVIRDRKDGEGFVLLPKGKSRIAHAFNEAGGKMPPR